MSKDINERELIETIAARTQVDPRLVGLVLKHEQIFINNAKANAKGEVDIDSDDLVDYILSRRDITLDEPEIDDILDAEMDYLMEKGLAGYVD